MIFIYYDNGVVDMQICALLTRIQCKVFDTQVAVKACWPLVNNVKDFVSSATFKKGIMSKIMNKSSVTYYVRWEFTVLDNQHPFVDSFLSTYARK